MTLTESFPQEELTRLTELRELIVHAAQPLQTAEALRRLPLLVTNYRVHHGPTVSPHMLSPCISCGLHLFTHFCQAWQQLLAEHSRLRWEQLPTCC